MNAHSKPHAQATNVPMMTATGTVIDFWKWSEVRKDEKGKKRYPEIPEYGTIYPLYADKPYVDDQLT